MTEAATLDAILDSYEPVLWTERRVISYARERLEEYADPAGVLAELQAAREDINDWIALEERYGIAEVLKLIGQWLLAGWGMHEQTTAAAWLAKLSGSPILDTGQSEHRAPAVFNLWRKERAEVWKGGKVG